ncbi:MAG: PIN domain-containing protein [Proteobacteria bacterium]|nr:PIN domain-containing protein [Pseudomonadota bacterium]
MRANGDEVFSSTLLHLELTRVLRRERLDPGLARPLIERIHQVSIDDGVLRFAAAIERHVKSLDAIHLATCALLGAGVTVATHDAGMGEAAAAMGLDAHDPLGDDASHG